MADNATITVRHRIDGLEKKPISPQPKRTVRHRIDGLEMHWHPRLMTS